MNCTTLMEKITSTSLVMNCSLSETVVCIFTTIQPSIQKDSGPQTSIIEIASPNGERAVRLSWEIRFMDFNYMSHNQGSITHLPTVHLSLQVDVVCKGHSCTPTIHLMKPFTELPFSQEQASRLLPADPP